MEYASDPQDNGHIPSLGMGVIPRPWQDGGRRGGRLKLIDSVIGR